MNVIDQVYELAGDQRRATFVKAAEFVLSLQSPVIIETGCYRGAACDGQSTLVMAILARETNGSFTSFELHQHNIDKARQLLSDNGLSSYANFVIGDSAVTLRQFDRKISFAYLDSYDFEEHKYIDAQSHQLMEFGALLPKMDKTSAILLDDCDLPRGGKGGLSVSAIKASGYIEAMSDYQKFFVRV